MNNSKEHFQGNWNKDRANNWHLFMPPARPSKGEMMQYEKCVQEFGFKNLSRWALLGATPEIRSLSAKFRKHLLCIDKNGEVFNALAKMVDLKFSEEFLCENWVDINISEPVDLIFGDGSLNMLNNELHESFIKKIFNMLNPCGRVLLRVHLAQQPKFSTPKQVFEWHREHNSKEPIFSSTRTHLDMLWMEPENLRICFPDYHKKICLLKEEGTIGEEEFLAYNKLLEYNKIELFYLTHKHFKEIISDYFFIKGIYDGDDYSRSAQHPIYLLQKKNL